MIDADESYGGEIPIAEPTTPFMVSDKRAVKHLDPMLRVHSSSPVLLTKKGPLRVVIHPQNFTQVTTGSYPINV